MLTLKKVSSKIIFKRAAILSLVSVFCLGLFYLMFSPLLITTSSASNLDSGQGSLLSFFSWPTALAATTGQVVASVVVGKEVMITAPSNFTLTGTIGGITGGTASGTAAFSVLNSSQSGFAMTLKASAAPALATGSYNFADYPSTNSALTGTPSLTWTAPAGGTSSFGFSVVADAAGNTNQKFRWTGSACNASGGANDAAHCWSPFVGTSNIPVISTSSFSAATVGESFIFQAAFTNDNVHSIAADTYQATITATVSTN